MLSPHIVRTSSIGELVDEYEKEVKGSVIHKGYGDKDLAIFALGLNGEAGEAAEKVKKYLRGDGPLDRELLIKELHDVIWYAVSLAHWCGVGFTDILKVGIAKMRDRRARGVTRGNGDTR